MNTYTITQEQLDAWTAEETDVAAAAANAVTRSQNTLAQLPILEAQIAAQSDRLAAVGQPVDLTTISRTLAAIKGELGAIAAPGVVVSPVGSNPNSEPNGPAADNAASGKVASGNAAPAASVQIPGTANNLDGTSSANVGDVIKAPVGDGGAVVDAEVTAKDNSTGTLTVQATDAAPADSVSADAAPADKTK